MSLLSTPVAYLVQLHRILLVECTRVENHLLNIACHAGDLGRLLALLHTTPYYELSMTTHEEETTDSITRGLHHP